MTTNREEMKMQNQTTGILNAPVKQSPAACMSDAVARLDVITDSLRRILCDARCQTEGPSECSPTPEITLEWVLHRAPATIHHKIDQCQDLIKELQSMLFD